MVRIYHISGKDRYSRSHGAGIDPPSGFRSADFSSARIRAGQHPRTLTDPLEQPRIEPNYFAENATAPPGSPCCD